MTNIDIDKFLLEQIRNNQLNPYSEITKNKSFNQTVNYIKDSLVFNTEEELLKELKNKQIIK